MFGRRNQLPPLTNDTYARWLRAQRPPLPMFLGLSEIEQEALAGIGDDYVSECITVLAETLRGVTVQRLARHKDGRRRTAVYDIIGEGARKFIDGGKPDAGFYISRAQDGIKQLEDAGSISKEEAERLRREVGA